MHTKIKDGKQKYHPHTLNGSALAVGRTLLAILENNFEKGVGVHMPKALKPYLNFDLIKIVK
jgi:seryl-tRNA synthetase